MPPTLAFTEAVARFLSCKARSLQHGAGIFRSAGRPSGPDSRLGRFDQARCLATLARSGNPCVGSSADGVHVLPIGTSRGFAQTRQFLGFFFGEDCPALSKVYKERRTIGYSPEQLFNVVSAVDMYEEFLPWCQRSKIVKRNSDRSFDAELQIGFKSFLESYLSHVEIDKPKRIKTTASKNGLFEHLINIWEFTPGSVPGSCELYFLVDFKFHSPLYRQVVSMFFQEVAPRLLSSFEDRCSRIYGPPVPVLETSYRQNI
ncbi:coenzyme Q-binding protein COQ10 homolog, mitochondrial-like [Zingiber officinale]|uniref:Coenzyme Q-binding protein COQ10 START domain-containing protein n=1 Tax=Zingiber officinale TaxID=94328 RepID=A0A8J5EZA0_ZINOF|nr:coenzyme Q-binding protein COQ10 homolog, mitochondrial-like [Zingiber officinale]KAG6476106.1 hypothetical protein ZIOFF_065342 [Zingiber officinale]